MKIRTSWLLAVLVVVVAVGCSRQDYQWGWYEVLPTTPQGAAHLRFLLAGLGLTISLSTISLSASIILGLLVALPGLARQPWLRAINRVYVETFRSIPVLVMILWVYYGFPVVIGLALGPFTAGILALTLCDSAFEAEVFRGGIQSVEKGQIEAADSLGLNYYQKMRLIILPQAIRRILPPLGNQFVYMLKMSSLVSVIGLQELTRRANELTVTVYRPLEIYSVLVLEYLLLILVASWMVRRVEMRMRVPTEV
ncbi:amino acid ABC transporter permease [Desulfosarcina sp.]|uniref:amino acid ABC transporter permease n=1 Tax=Desulfosarcina sp. TaxID=2027861 RepID=UPI003561509A